MDSKSIAIHFFFYFRVAKKIFPLVGLLFLLPNSISPVTFFVTGII